MGDGIFCEDILVGILSRLPKKSLSRFKCVSKEWYALISDRNRVLPKTTDVGFFCESVSDIDNTKQTTFFRVDNEGSASLNDSLGFSRERGCSILDSCNGLLLLQKGQRCLYVYNPVTNLSVNLPLPSTGRWTAGIGLASDGEHFKVIRFFYRDYINVFDFEIFSSLTGQWREIQWKVSTYSFIFDFSDSAHSVSLKGAIHWIWGDYLLIYHLEDEYCKLIKLPEHKKNRYIFDNCIWDSEGFLHYCFGDENGIHIWVLHMEDRNYNPHQHIFDWQLKHSAILTPPMSKEMHRDQLESFFPRVFNDDFGIVYLTYYGCILSYNLATGMLKEVCAHPFGDPNDFIWDILKFSYSMVESPSTIASTVIKDKEKLFNCHMKDAMKKRRRNEINRIHTTKESTADFML